MKAFYLLIINTIILCGRCWEYKENEEVCVSIEGDVTFSITYEKKNGEGKITDVYAAAIPKGAEAVTITGACEDESSKQSNITMKWGGGFQADFVFFKNVEKDHWYAEKCQLSYPNSLLPDAFVTENSTSARTTVDQELFLTRQTDFYLCKSSDTHPLYLFTDDKVNTTANIVNLASSNLTIKPFKSLKEAYECTKDSSKTDPPKPKTDPPKPKTEPPQPQPAPKADPGPSGSRVAWTCTVVSLLVLSVCAIFIYHNKDGTPAYVRVV